MADKQLTLDEQAYVDLLNQVANDLTAKILTPEYSHFLDMWKAVLGGFVCRELGKYVTIDASTQKTIDTYTPEMIRLLTSGKTEVVEVEKIIEKKVIERVTVPAPAVVSAVGDPTMPMVTGAGGNTSGVLRNKPAGVQKVIRKKRELTPEERMIIIQKFNSEQRLVDPSNPICTDLINAFPSSPEPSFPAQVAGYWSFLCRIVVKVQGDLEQWYKNAVMKGSLPAGCPKPIASANFQKIIVENLEEQKSLTQHRKNYQAHMAASPVASAPKTATIATVNFR